jgi:hypothetical protein
MVDDGSIELLLDSMHVYTPEHRAPFPVAQLPLDACVTKLPTRQRASDILKPSEPMEVLPSEWKRTVKAWNDFKRKNKEQMQALRETAPARIEAYEQSMIQQASSDAAASRANDGGASSSSNSYVHVPTPELRAAQEGEFRDPSNPFAGTADGLELMDITPEEMADRAEKLETLEFDSVEDLLGKHEAERAEISRQIEALGYIDTDLLAHPVWQKVMMVQPLPVPRDMFFESEEGQRRAEDLEGREWLVVGWEGAERVHNG